MLQVTQRQVVSDPPRPWLEALVRIEARPRLPDPPEGLHRQLLRRRRVPHDPHDPPVDLALVLAKQRLERREIALGEGLETRVDSQKGHGFHPYPGSGEEVSVLGGGAGGTAATSPYAGCRSRPPSTSWRGGDPASSPRSSFRGCSRRRALVVPKGPSAVEVSLASRAGV